jgi:hypothetical protein
MKDRRVNSVPVAHACNPSYLRGRDQEDWSLKPSQNNSQKYPTQKRTGGVAQVVECLPSNCKAQNSNLSTSKKYTS